MLSTAIALMQWDITAFSGPDKWLRTAAHGA